MKAMILCGGQGTRLRPLTFTTSKPLIPVANQMIIQYTIESIKKTGIDEICIVVNPSNQQEFARALGDGAFMDVHIEYVIQKDPKGIAHAVSLGRDFVRDQPFLLYLGDNMILEDLTPFVERFLESDYQASLLLSPVQDPKSFGIATLQGDRIVQVVEKPENPPSNLGIIGVYLFHPMIFEVISGLKPSWRGEYEITDAIGALLAHDFKVQSHILQGWWKDTGNPDDLLEANRKILDIKNTREKRLNHSSKSPMIGFVQMGENCQIDHSVVRGPVVLGKEVMIRNAYIGPYTSIGDYVHIEGSEIENSILLSHVSIIDLPKRIDNSIVGHYTKIGSQKGVPQSVRLITGDHTKVEFP